ncbi:MAG: hypothetical protein Q8L44_00210 [Sulfuritalea sp.]|nr:hypothetical protein [Sulfuritalea sp.]
MLIGFDENTGHVYEGLGVPSYPVWPSPTLSQAKLIESQAEGDDLARGVPQTALAWIFREDMFDPVTRIRRGRLYEPYSGQPKRTWPVRAHPFDHEGARQVAASGGLNITLLTYSPCQSFANRPDRGLGMKLAIGHRQSISLWRVVQTELVLGDDVLVTLKAMTAYGIIPQLNYSEVSQEARQAVDRALERIVDVAFRETPISVVDHCRNAATVVLSRWLAQKGAPQDILSKDLDDVCKALGKPPFEKAAARDAAEAIRLLHPRGKANVQEAKGYRIPTDEDAEFAIHAIGFILRELEWAK